MRFHYETQEKPIELEVVGDGSQTESYLYIDDCIDAVLLVVDKTRAEAKGHIEIYNLGSKDQVEVRKIAEIIINVMKLKDGKLRF